MSLHLICSPFESPKYSFILYGQSNCYLRIIKHKFICFFLSRSLFHSLIHSFSRRWRKNEENMLRASRTTCRNDRRCNTKFNIESYRENHFFKNTFTFFNKKCLYERINRVFFGKRCSKLLFKCKVFNKTPTQSLHS